LKAKVPEALKPVNVPELSVSKNGDEKRGRLSRLPLNIFGTATASSN